MFVIQVQWRIESYIEYRHDPLMTNIHRDFPVYSVPLWQQVSIQLNTVAERDGFLAFDQPQHRVHWLDFREHAFGVGKVH